MKLSIVIVNYNVGYFLEQCLHSVYKALQHNNGDIKVSAEVFVVDNASVDNSCELVRKKFPQVRLIANPDNLGFSRANNQAMLLSKGEYVLLLNPDTVVEEDTFEKVIRFMDEHPEAGGLGVKMIDGKGKFLPESKRGLPTPAVAFYKIFGISRIFPKSRRFGRYHMGYLDNDTTNEVEILAGCFMLMRKTVLDRIGLLDEAFFMYGEDIDLSWRIIKSGYKNYYFPETRIIHYKGESTKKSSINYVFVFYKAMVIFAKKHFSEKHARLFSFLINCAIWLRASAAIFNRFLHKTILPLTDAIFVGGGLFLLTHYYEIYAGKNYPVKLISVALPVYTLVWLVGVFFSGGYDKPLRLLRILQGLVIATGIILAGYALLPKASQFSRIIILLGAAWASVYYGLSRFLLHLSKPESYRLGPATNRRFIIIGFPDEAQRVADLLTQTLNSPTLIGVVHPEKNQKQEGFIGHIGQLKEITEIYRIDELVFCARDLSAQQIIGQMSVIENKRLDFKIAPPESLYIIGSNSIETSGDLYVLDINSIRKPKNQRNKRMLDGVVALILLLLLPVSIWPVNRKGGFIRNIFQVLIGKKSWIGYGKITASTNPRLPRIKPGVLSPLHALRQKEQPNEVIHKLNVVYAKDYQVRNDVKMIWKGFRHLGE